MGAEQTAIAVTANSVTDHERKRGEWLQPYRFKPGQSGNPNGRPKKITSALDRALNRHNTKRIAYALIGEAQAGNVQAFKEIRETIEGPLPKPIELSGPEGGPLVISHRLELAKDRLTKWKTVDVTP